MSILVTPNGEPIAPTEIVRALQERAQDDRLSVKWLAGLKCWGLFLAWTDQQRSDRAEMIRKNNIAPSDWRDLLFPFPADATVHDVIPYFENRIAKWHDKEQVSRIQDGIDKHNAKVQKDLIDATANEAEVELDRAREAFYQMGLAPSQPFQGFGKGKRSVEVLPT